MQAIFHPLTQKGTRQCWLCIHSELNVGKKKTTQLLQWVLAGAVTPCPMLSLLSWPSTRFYGWKRREGKGGRLNASSLKIYKCIWPLFLLPSLPPTFPPPPSPFCLTVWVPHGMFPAKHWNYRHSCGHTWLFTSLLGSKCGSLHFDGRFSYPLRAISPALCVFAFRWHIA